MRILRKAPRALIFGLSVTVAAGAASAGAVLGGSVLGGSVLGGSAARAAVAAPAGDSPPGFRYGTDSWPVPGMGSAPYKEPHIGGSYGGYIGMAGNWVREEGCHTGNFLAWSSTDSAEANTNYTKYHIGIGTGAYWYMGGPGVDPHWNGTAPEASAWGARQAAWALAAMKKLHVTYPVLWADIELPGIEPAPDNGWDSVYTGPCSWHVKISSVPASVDRAEFNGFASYVAAHSSYKVGVYSAPSVWTSIFGTGSASRIPGTYEWTFESLTSHLSGAPSGWCLQGTSGCAQFFGGQSSSSKYALMWQWSGGGGSSNGYGDFDQIDVARMG
jgi:hypothetical protein